MFTGLQKLFADFFLSGCTNICEYYTLIVKTARVSNVTLKALPYSPRCLLLLYKTKNRANRHMKKNEYPGLLMLLATIFI